MKKQDVQCPHCAAWNEVDIDAMPYSATATRMIDGCHICHRPFKVIVSDPYSYSAPKS